MCLSLSIICLLQHSQLPISTRGMRDGSPICSVIDGVKRNRFLGSVDLTVWSFSLQRTQPDLRLHHF